MPTSSTLNTLLDDCPVFQGKTFWEDHPIKKKKKKSTDSFDFWGEEEKKKKKSLIKEIITEDLTQSQPLGK